MDHMRIGLSLYNQHGQINCQASVHRSGTETDGPCILHIWLTMQRRSPSANASITGEVIPCTGAGSTWQPSRGRLAGCRARLDMD